MWKHLRRIRTQSLLAFQTRVSTGRKIALDYLFEFLDCAEREPEVIYDLSHMG